jgi:hypothetical protein
MEAQLTVHGKSSSRSLFAVAQQQFSVFRTFLRAEKIRWKTIKRTLTYDAVQDEWSSDE